MDISRRLFIRNGVATVSFGIAAPSFLTAIAEAQSVRTRNLVVVYLGGGNDALNTLVSYRDPAYYSRRPSIAVPAGQVLQVGSDAAGQALGLHPRLGGLLNIFNEGRLALVQRTGYANSSRSHFEATDIWGTANPQASTGSGWLGRYLDALPRPLDALAAWNTTAETPRALISGTSGVPAIPNASTYSFASPNRGAAAAQERAAAQIMASNPASGRPHLAFVNSTARGAIETLDRVALATSYTPTVAYPDGGFADALQTVAGAIVRGIGSRVFWLQTGGYDTHAGQGGGGGGDYASLMGTLGDGLSAFYLDIRNQGLAGDTTVIVFSEFGRRISENGSAGTDHGAAGLMMVLGGSVRGGIHGTAAALSPGHPTLENSSGDVRYETDFRSVYARLLDQWLGVNSVPILGGDFRAGAPAIF
ncbi:MAG TPA: DUF1501 domain-containing protein [Vicinamibacterales bacterium]|nr:DUF1501 domain-containing protein [Vicinamibacterales bacterium]